MSSVTINGSRDQEGAGHLVGSLLEAPWDIYTGLVLGRRRCIRTWRIIRSSDQFAEGPRAGC